MRQWITKKGYSYFLKEQIQEVPEWMSNGNR